MHENSRTATSSRRSYGFTAPAREHLTQVSSPAGRDPGPAIRAADAAAETGSAEAVAKILVQAVEHGLHEQFERVRRTAGYAPDDVRAGREHVKAYVAFVHYVERLYAAAAIPAHGHAEEPTGPAVPGQHRR